MISVICVYNNKDALDELLLKSLKHQTFDYELILIDNTRNKFESASKALNYGGNKAKGNYLMFVHQDVKLCSEYWFKEVEKTLKSVEKLGIAGVAGVAKNQSGIISNMKHGNPPKWIGKHIESPSHVQTLDECLVIIPRSIFKEFNFDENLSGWHLYCVDYCLNILKHNYNAYVIPQIIYHRSHGSANSDEYFSILKIILEKYENDYSKINTTLGIWYTKRSIIIQKIFYSLKVWVLIILNKLKIKQ